MLYPAPKTSAAGACPAAVAYHAPVRLARSATAPLLRLCALAVAGLVMLTAPSIHRAAAAELVIGVAGPMSGPLAEAGNQYRAAVTHAAKEINAAGGLNGDRLTIVSADDQATPKGARIAASQLIAKKARIVIGHYNSTPTIAASEAYGENNILLLAPQAIIARLTEKKAWNVFRLAPRDDAQAKAAADFLASRKKPARIALVHDTSTFSRTLAEATAAALQAKNIVASVRGEIPPGSRHTQSIITRLADRIATAGVTHVFWTGSASDAARLLSALRKRKSTAMLLGTDVLASSEFTNGANPDDLAGARMLLPDAPPANIAVFTLLQELNIGKQADTGPAIAAYAAMQLVAAAARAAKSNAPRDIAKILHTGQAIATITGPMSFDAKGDRREKLFHVHRWQYAEDGKLTYARDQ